MRLLKLLTHLLLIALLAIGASGVANAKVASGTQNLLGTAYLGDDVVNWLTLQGKSARSTTGPPGSPVAAKNTKLYRSVGEAELKQIKQTGKFEAGPNSLGGKFFAESVDDAKKWGDAFGNSRIVET